MNALITITGGPEINKNDLGKVLAFAIANYIPPLGQPPLSRVLLVKEWDGDMESLPGSSAFADVVIACILKEL